MPRRLGLLALVAALLAATAPGARAAWTTPQRATGSGRASAPSVDVDAAGRLALAFVRRTEHGPRVELRRGSLANGLRGAPVIAARSPDRPDAASVVVDTATGETLTAWQEGLPPTSLALLSRRDGTPLTRLGPFGGAVDPYAIRAPDASVRLVLHGAAGLSVLEPRGARIDLPAARRDVRVAVTLAGETVAVWTDGPRVRLAVAPPGGGFAVPQTLLAPGVPAAPLVAAGPDGGVLVTWLARTATGTGVVDVARAPDGALGPIIQLVGAGEDARAPSLAAAANGERLLTYVDGAGILRLRRMRPDGTPIGSAMRVTGGGERTNGAALAVTPSATHVVWSSGTSVRARRIAPGGALGRVAVIAPAGADEGAVPVAAGSTTGGAAAAWVAGGRVELSRNR